MMNQGTMKVANIQKVGALRFYGAPGDDRSGIGRAMVEIPAGEEREVPDEIWSRYSDRPDIKSAHGIRMIIGGFGAMDPTHIIGDSAAKIAIAAQRAEIEAERAELEALRAELEARTGGKGAKRNA